MTVPDFSDARLQARRIHEADVDALAALCIQCSDFFQLVQDTPGSREVALEIVSELAPGMGPDSKHLLGFWAADEMVAMVDLAEGYPQRLDWWVALFLVTPAFRGRGVGRAIWSATESWMKSRGAENVRLVVQEQNARARRFWETAGFAVVSEAVQKLPTRENRVYRLLKRT